jgi:cytochrome P450
LVFVARDDRIAGRKLFTVHPKENLMTKAAFPPGPKYLIPFIALYALQKDPPAYLLRMAQKYGDIAHLKVGPQHFFLLNHPDYIKDVLVTHAKNFMKGQGLQRAKLLLGEGLLTSEGDFHLRQRRLMQPVFHRQRIIGYAQTMIDYGVRRRASWQADATVDMHAEMMSLTMAIVGKTLFDADVEDKATEVREALHELLEIFELASRPTATLLGNVSARDAARFERGKAQLDAIIYRLIDVHRQSGDRGDLLSMLIETQDTEGDGARMTNEQIRDEAMTLFLAGHETTANALTWSWYLLSQNPAAEARFHAELDTALAGRLPTPADIERLPYTRMVLSESMRLYPPAWTLGRRALNDYTVAGYTIPKGSIVMMSQWVMHHDARYYPDPFRFKPERWTPDEVAKRPRFAYFPFGGGARMCIGDQFAWTEGILLLATLGQRWKFQLAPKHPIALLPRITLRPKYGMMMTLHKR